MFTNTHRDGGKTWADGNSPAVHNLERIFFVGDLGWASGFGGTVLTHDANATNHDTGNKKTLPKRN